MWWSFMVAVAADAGDEPEPVDKALVVSGFVEVYGSYNFNNPDNGVTNLRGFDARNGTFALSLASVGVGVDHPTLRGQVSLQAGPTALSYFLAEPSGEGGSGVAPTSGAALHLVREAWVGGHAEVGEGLDVDAGVFLSPVGYDSIAVKDNRLWSLSNLGVGLPFYFTGVKAALGVGRGTTLTLGGFNGWNSVVDANRGKSVQLALARLWPSGAEAQVLYLGGVEAEGLGFRHLFDVWWDVPIGPVGLFGGLNAGVEPRDAGLHAWQAGQIGAEVSVTGPWTVGLRGDLFRERGPEGTSTHIFWPTTLLGEVTAGVGVRPTDGLLVRLEARHDRAADPVFFAGEDVTPSRGHQTTVTLGATGWFAGRVATP